MIVILVMATRATCPYRKDDGEIGRGGQQIEESVENLVNTDYLIQCARLPCCGCIFVLHDDVIKWKHFPRYWSFVRGIHP